MTRELSKAQGFMKMVTTYDEIVNKIEQNPFPETTTNDYFIHHLQIDFEFHIGTFLERIKSLRGPELGLVDRLHFVQCEFLKISRIDVNVIQLFHRDCLYKETLYIENLFKRSSLNISKFPSINLDQGECLSCVMIFNSHFSSNLFIQQFSIDHNLELIGNTFIENLDISNCTIKGCTKMNNNQIKGDFRFIGNSLYKYLNLERTTWENIEIHDINFPEIDKGVRHLLDQNESRFFKKENYVKIADSYRSLKRIKHKSCV